MKRVEFVMLFYRNFLSNVENNHQWLTIHAHSTSICKMLFLYEERWY